MLNSVARKISRLLGVSASLTVARAGEATVDRPPTLGRIPGDSRVSLAIAEQSLYEAWQRVKENEGAAGTDGQDIKAFSSNALGRLQQLKGEVERGTYCPAPLREVEIPKGNGRLRKLAIPSVRDRVLQTAVASAIGPALDAEFSDVSYAYRPRRSSASAVARVAQYREQGLVHVLDADIDGYFDNIDHRLLMQMVARYIPDEGIRRHVALWLAAIIEGTGGPRLAVKGIAQGSPLSPLLSNLYLDGFDDALIAAGIRHVRFADDFVVCCRTQDDAVAARAVVERELAKIKLRLSGRKTRVTSFFEGFQFLGVRFTHNLVEAVDPEAAAWVLPEQRHLQQARAVERLSRMESVPPGNDRLPAAATPAEPVIHRTLDPDGDAADEAVVGAGAEEGSSPDVRLSASASAPLLQSLYVAEPGAWLTKDQGRVVVSLRKEVLASVPLGQLDQISVMANAMVSTALLAECGERRIHVSFSAPGRSAVLTMDRGALPDLALLHAQLDANENDPLKLMLARAFVEGKVHNQRLVLRRFTRHDDRALVEGAIRQIDDAQAKLDRVTTIDQVRGLEGIAARAYFGALKALLPAELAFSGRVRRPPADPTNVLLSLGYAVLTANMHSMVRLSGLNPHLGALHVTAAGSLALVCDLIEEFRAPVVDSVALAQLRSGEIGNLDFEWEPGGELPCRLKAEARRRFLSAIETRLESRFIHARLLRSLDWRRAMQAQVQHYQRVLSRIEPAYLPLKMR